MKGYSSWRIDVVPENAEALDGFNKSNDRLVELVDDADLHNALVLADDCRKWWCYGTLFWMNSPTLDGDVVFAKDVESLRAELFAAYPDRAVYVATYGNPSLVPFGTTPPANGGRTPD